MGRRILNFFAALLFPLPLLAFHQLTHGADATSFDPTKVEVKAQGSGGVPVGTIISWPVATNPEDMNNWLECNGQSISQSVYPELFALVGGRVPDLRGLFLRGHGGNSAGLGTLQGDAIRNITGTFYGEHYNEDYLGFYSGAVTKDRYFNSFGWSARNGGSGRMKFDASRVVPTAEENRPVNKAVRYLIRARP